MGMPPKAGASVVLRRVRAPEGWLRKLCMALPGTEETKAWGHPNFRAGGRTFAVFEVYKGRPSIAIGAEPEEQTFLVERFGFFRTPYVGNRGWVSAWVDEPAPFGLMRDLVANAYRRTLEGAPRARAPRGGRKSASRGSAGGPASRGSRPR